MTSPKVALVLGSGPRIGAAVATRISKEGYQVVIASRKGTNSKTEEGYLSVRADFSDPSSVVSVFEAVKKEFQTAPSVVVYNAPALTPPPNQASLLSIPSASVTKDLIVNTVSPYVAAQEAVRAWDASETGEQKTFIYTGNIQNVMVLPVPMMLDLGMGKAASAYWIGAADAAYSAKNYRFFYADERNANGTMKGMTLDGTAHAELFISLARAGADAPWHATFVGGQLKKF